jgi:hypothetical protein
VEPAAKLIDKRSAKCPDNKSIQILPENQVNLIVLKDVLRPREGRRREMSESS